MILRALAKEPVQLLRERRRIRSALSGYEPFVPDWIGAGLGGSGRGAEAAVGALATLAAPQSIIAATEPNAWAATAPSASFGTAPSASARNGAERLG